MPRKRRGFEEPPRRTVSSLVARLADELKANRPSGQPMIEEEQAMNALAIMKDVLNEAAERLVA